MKNQLLRAWDCDAVTHSHTPVGFLDPENTAFSLSAELSSAQRACFNPINALPRTPGAYALLTDSLPDSWGRRVMAERETALARKEERRPLTLSEESVLAGVCDTLRQGAARFSFDDAGENFVGATRFALLTEKDLPAAYETAHAVESGLAVNFVTLDAFSQNASALGGSRPKVSFVDCSGALSLAKFPSVADRRDKGAWEALAMTLARRAGIAVPEFNLLDLGLTEGRIFISRRFDRGENGIRRHYLSTAAMLGTTAAMQKRSYLEILMLIERVSSDVQADREELWRRVLFKMMIGCGDDHLRNHGFLYTASGWRLAPAFDLNPSLSTTCLTLTWDENCSEYAPRQLVAAAPVWGLAVERAREIHAEVLSAVRSWKDVADSLGIADREIHQMEHAFLRNAL